VGYTEAELLSTSFQSLTHPDDLSSNMALQDSLLAGRTDTLQLEKRYLHRDGHLIWVMLGIAMVRSQEGKPLHTVSQIHDISERKATSQRLERLLSEQKSMLSNELVGIVRVKARHIAWANPAFERMLGYGPGELTDTPTSQNYPNQAVYEEFGAKAYAVILAGEVFRSEVEHRRKDGSTVWLEASGAILDGQDTESLWSFVDITKRLEQAHALAVSEQRMDLALAGADLGLWDVEFPSGRISHNARLYTMVGYSPDELDVELNSLLSFLHPDDHGAYRHAFMATLRGDSPNLEAEFRLRHKDGHWVWVLSRGKVVERDSRHRAMRMAGTNLDISDRKRNEALIHELAFYDPLTHLPNRRLLLDRIAQALPASERRGNHGAVLYLDLDKFKALNDSRGHEAGDALLQEVAKRLLACVRTEDTVSRPGGDEFVIVIRELSLDPGLAREEVSTIGRNIREALSAPYALLGLTHECTCSIGICLFKGITKSGADIIKHADQAMYQAKMSGRNAVHVFDDAL
jgi:diguanylate cyclase (GGDEF)-like protein/PAS domain S-box-containing protein